MDENKPNRSLDGMQSNKPNTSGGVDGFTSPASSQPVSAPEGEFNDADYSTEAQPGNEQPVYNDDNHGDTGQSSNKGLKLVLTLFVILFIAATAAAAYFYMENSKADTPVTATTVDITKLEQENDSLTYDNKTLQTQNNAYQVQVKSLTTTANQLKTKCGSSCSSITVPQ